MAVKVLTFDAVLGLSHAVVLSSGPGFLVILRYWLLCRPPRLVVDNICRIRRNKSIHVVIVKVEYYTSCVVAVEGLMVSVDWQGWIDLDQQYRCFDSDERSHTLVGCRMGGI